MGRRFRHFPALREHRRILTSGFGSGDLVINKRLNGWFDWDPVNRLVLLHENPQELCDRSILLASSYDPLVASGRLVPLGKWLSDTRWADVAGPLQDPA